MSEESRQYLKNKLLKFMAGFESLKFGVDDVLENAEKERKQRNERRVAEEDKILKSRNAEEDEGDRVKKKEDSETETRVALDEKLTALLLEKYWLDIEIKEMEENSQEVNAIGTSLKDSKDKQIKLKKEIGRIKETLDKL